MCPPSGWWSYDALRIFVRAQRAPTCLSRVVSHNRPTGVPRPVAVKEYPGGTTTPARSTAWDPSITHARVHPRRPLQRHRQGEGEADNPPMSLAAKQTRVRVKRLLCPGGTAPLDAAFSRLSKTLPPSRG